MITPLTREAYEMKMRAYLGKHTQLFSNSISKESSNICVKTKDDPFWKPYLTLRTETEDGKTIIRGIFGPSNAVWTFFMFLYFAFSTCWMTFFTLWWVTDQIKSKDYPWALSVSMVFLFLMIATWAASWVGKILAKKEMDILREFAEQSMQGFDFSDF